LTASIVAASQARSSSRAAPFVMIVEILFTMRNLEHNPSHGLPGGDYS
jgi:hypothetical protein